MNQIKERAVDRIQRRLAKTFFEVNCSCAVTVTTPFFTSRLERAGFNRTQGQLDGVAHRWRDPMELLASDGCVENREQRDGLRRGLPC